MKLISCHIVRFGKLADADLDFAPGLSGVLRENGAGKSTLSAFLSAMFFGLPTVNKRGVDFNDREHFRPFGGGSFGGSLLFETDAGDRYRIERTFDEKTETKDLLTVYKNDAPFDCGGREIGELLFGVDADAFTRTAFLSAETLDPKPGKSLSDRLCEAISNPEGTVSADKAIKALDDAAKKIVQGGGKKNGAYHLALAEEVKTEAVLRTAKETAKTLPALREEYEKAVRGLSARNQNKLWASYDDLCAREKEAEAKLAAANVRFADGVPDDAALGEIEHKITARETAARDADAIFSPNVRQSALVARFESKRPDGAALAEMEEKARQIRDAKQTASRAQTPQSPASETAKTAGWILPVAAGGGLGVLAGLILLILSYTLPGAILLVLGVIGLGAGLCFLFQGKVNALASSISAVDPGGVERARRAQLDADLSALLAPYGYSSPDGALAAYSDLKRDLDELTATEEEKAAAAKKQANAKERLSALDRELSEFFAGYAIPTDAGCRPAMTALRDAIRDRNTLIREIGKAKKEAADFAVRHNLTSRPEGDAGNADPALIAALEGERDRLLVEIDKAEAEANRVPDLEEALAKAKERAEELKSRYTALAAARDLLRTAQENLVRRYVDPVKTSFVNYADALSSFLGKTVSLNSRFELAYEADGAYRDVRHLSAGENCVASLCLRMALSDSLYKGREQPPLILDDPLVHLDEKNLEKAKALLRRVAETRQIVYLTCHSSRAV